MAFSDHYGTNKSYRLTANVAYTFSDGIVLKSITGYQYGQGNGNVDLNELGLPFSSFEDYGRETIFSQELNLGLAGHRAVALGRRPLLPARLCDAAAGRRPAGLRHPRRARPNLVFEDLDLVYRTPKTTEAAFGQVSYDINHALQLQVGLRYTNETFGLRDEFADPAHGVRIDDSAVGRVATAHTSDSAPPARWR